MVTLKIRVFVSVSNVVQPNNRSWVVKEPGESNIYTTQCYLRCKESMSDITKYRTLEKKMRCRFSTRAITSKWILTTLEITVEFVLK